MRLIDHLKEAGKSVSAFAEEVGEAENTIRKIVYGQRQPSLALAVKISGATNGVVSEADLLLIPKPAASQDAA